MTSVMLYKDHKSNCFLMILICLCLVVV